MDILQFQEVDSQSIILLLHYLICYSSAQATILNTIEQNPPIFIDANLQMTWLPKPATHRF